MCGRYTLTEPDNLAVRFDLREPTEIIRPNYNVAPTQTMPVIVDANGTNSLVLMRWGIPRFIGPGKVKEVFNTRADKAFWSWKKLTSTQRVLVPATGFYEWKQQADGKQPFFIRPRDGQLFSFAGIWNTWKDDQGQSLQTYSIITTEPNAEMSTVHNRMPVILHPDDEAVWLSSANNNNREALEALLRPYDDDSLEISAVSKDVNVASINREHLVYPLNSS